MALKIKLARRGKKKNPRQRIVVAQSSKNRDSDFIELIGSYNPVSDPPVIKINRERANYWLKMGAIPTESVKHILKKGRV